MISKIKYWAIIIASATLVTLILANNKSKLEEGIIKENNGIHPVVVEQVKFEKLNSKLIYTGITAAVNDVELISETSGKVEKVFIENGNRVSNNSIIAKIDDQILEANYKLAEAALDKAKLDFARYETLIKEGNLSSNDLENSRIALKSAEVQFVLAKKYLSNASITSPIYGILVSRYINAGSTVAPGSPVANIIDISKLKIKINIPEKDISKIKTMAIAQISSALFPGKIFEARVINVSVKADESHNYRVELLIDNSNNIFSAGMYVDVEFAFSTRVPVKSILRNSLIDGIKNPKVFIILNNKAFEKEILTGGEMGNRLIILKGLNAGEQVVVEGQNNLNEGSSVTIKNNESI